MSDKVENLDGLDAVDLFDKRSLASIAISLKRIADVLAKADTPNVSGLSHTGVDR